MALNTYLTFDGNCREAFEFYRSAFGGEFAVIQTFADGPPDMAAPDDIRDQIMHVALPVGGSVLMGSDKGPGFRAELVAGNNFSISVSGQSREHCDEVFAKLSAGGKVTMPLQDMFWGSYYGMCTDRFGINWMISHDPPRE